MTEPPPALAHLPRQLPNMYSKDLPRQSSGREEKSTSTAAEVVRSAKDALRVATCSQARPSKFQVNLREPETSSRQRSTNTASRIHQAREQVIGSNARTLDWSLYVQHEKISCIRVQLSAARDKTVKSIGGEDVPACLIEVCAEGHPADGAARGHKLIRCSGSLVPRRSRLHVNWLGRKGACPEKPDPQVRVGCAPVGKPEARPGTPSWAVLRGECGSDRASGPPYTVAQAVLATLAAIGGLFGMIIIELDAEDNGSGKLVQYYTQLGFSVVVQVKGFDVEMEAPLATVAQNAPEDWIRGLMPEDFDAWGWLNPRSNRRGGIADHDPARAVLLAPDVPWDWSWKVAFPNDARVDAKLSMHESSRVNCEVYLWSSDGQELVSVRGSVRIKQQALRLIWLGRSKSRAVHPSVRGKLVYRAGDDSATAACNCTSATAVLGALAALARWFGANTVHLNTLGDSTGRLLRHFGNLGFELESPHLPACDVVALTASCKSLVKRCCPPEWRAELPIDGGLSMLQNLQP